MTTIDARIGSAVRRLRERRKLSLRALASMLDMDFGELSRHERGLRTWSASRVYDVAVLLGVRVSSLYPRAGE